MNKPIKIEHWIEPERFEEYLMNLRDMDTGRLDDWGSVLAFSAEHQAETQKTKALIGTTYVDEKDEKLYDEMKQEKEIAPLHIRLDGNGEKVICGCTDCKCGKEEIKTFENSLEFNEANVQANIKHFGLKEGIDYVYVTQSIG